mmetsp:Transcript_4972/g.7523  ORF Transcript_4972/g.7523 Transcript_4972/m.7523 type:complete len:113 (-) Transcript_4972:14-352(-)
MFCLSKFVSRQLVNSSNLSTRLISSSPIISATTRTEIIKEVLLKSEALEAKEVQVIDHNNNQPGGHVEVHVCSPKFDGLKMLDQHRLVNEVLAEEMKKTNIHALHIRTKKPQ